MRGLLIAESRVPEGFRTLNIVIHSRVTRVLLYVRLTCPARKSNQTIDNRIRLKRLGEPLPGCHAVHPLQGHAVCRPRASRSPRCGANSGSGLSVNRYVAPGLLDLNLSHLHIVHLATSPVTILASPRKLHCVRPVVTQLLRCNESDLSVHSYLCTF